MMSDLQGTVLERHSLRKFLPVPVPREALDQALALLQHAPPNYHTNLWLLVFAGGSARDRLGDALFRAAEREPPHIPALPKASERHRYELGPVYGSVGIPIADTARHAAAAARYIDFFWRSAGRHYRRAPGPEFGGCSERRHVSADFDVCPEPIGVGHLRGSLGRRILRCPPNRAEHPAGVYDPLRPGRRLSRSGPVDRRRTNRARPRSAACRVPKSMNSPRIQQTELVVQ